MKWIKNGSFYISPGQVEIRSLRIKDEGGKFRRFRVCTVWKDFLNFTKTPGTGKLMKTKEGQIGVLVGGKNMGIVKVGKNYLVQSSIIVPPGCVSKKPLNKLLKGYSIELIEKDGVIIGIER
jgi:hypothetical protein